MKFIFSFNQVSAQIAVALAKNCHEKIYIIYSQSRVSTDVGANNIVFLKYHPLWGLIVAALGALFESVEVVIPHPKCGYFTPVIQRFSRNIAYVDDGMDSFRVKPKNLDLSSIREGVNYYTFNYSAIEFAHWTKCLNVVRLASVDAMVEGRKDVYDLRNIDNVIVESSGVPLNLNLRDRVVRFCHPSLLKTTEHSKSEVFNVISGLYSIEASLANFDGNIFIGETLVFIYLIEKERFEHLNVIMKKEQYDNLEVLHDFIAKCASLEIL